MSLDVIVIRSKLTHQMISFIAFERMPLFVDYFKEGVKKLNKKYPLLIYEYLENVESPFQQYSNFMLN